jgi:membrane protein YqaA with SNARE-associated domain
MPAPGHGSTPTLAVPARPVSPTTDEKAVPWWALPRRLYNWMLSFAESRYATLALFVFSFCESIFFPIPPDVLQIPLTLERRSRAWYYATVSTVASVLGGIVGYGIGRGMWELVKPVLGWLIRDEAILRLQAWCNDHLFWKLLTAAVVFHPYKVFTVGSGVLGLSLPLFILASIIGRGSRFYLIAALLWRFGPPVRVFIERYFNILTVVLTILLIAGVLAVRFI